MNTSFSTTASSVSLSKAAGKAATKRAALKAGVLALAWAAAALTAPTQAQDALERAAPPGARVPTLPCCRCVGETTRLTLNTGAGVWTVNGAPATILPGPFSNGWTNALAPAAKWLAPAASAGSDYELKTSFFIPKCAIGSSVQINGKFAADNRATIHLDSTQIGATSNGSSGQHGFVTPAPISWSGALAPGLHTITIKVHNDSGSTGAVATMDLVRRCVTDEGGSGPVPAGQQKE
jgi:hypothetical protein